MAIVLAIDLSRTVISLRTARQYGSEALRSNAIHFGSDFAGTLAVLAGLGAAAPATRRATRSQRSSLPLSCSSPPAGSSVGTSTC